MKILHCKVTRKVHNNRLFTSELRNDDQNFHQSITRTSTDISVGCKGYIFIPSFSGKEEDKFV